MTIRLEDILFLVGLVAIGLQYWWNVVSRRTKKETSP